MKISEVTNKVVRTSDPIPKLSKPTRGREQKHPYTGMLVGGKKNEADMTGMYIPKNSNPVYKKMITFLEFAKEQGFTDVNHILAGNNFDTLVSRLTNDTGVDLTEEALTEEQFDEAAGEKDACYHKVKSRYKVWPSAYASGALVQCRKKGAANWGNKSKK